jgi:phosphodiesterase/alkaline phosphatase D-like protein
MKRLFGNRVLLILAAGLPLSWPVAAQTSAYTPKDILPPAKRAVKVQIKEGPALESFRNDEAIIRWTSTNPGGSDQHFAVVHYGTDPEHLTETAKSPVRLNQNHPYTVFRVRVEGLKPGTTYYYTVDSMQATGESDGVKSSVNHFTATTTSP